MTSYADVKVAGIYIRITGAKSAEEAEAKWSRAKVAVDSLFVALEKHPE